MKKKLNIKAIEKHWNETAQKDVMHYISWSGDWGIPHGKARFYAAGKTEVEVLMFRLCDYDLGDSALEVGCGIGRQTKELSTRFKKLYAVDISEKMIERAKEELSEIKNIDFKKIDGINLTHIKNNSISFVYSFIVLQHISKEPACKLINEMCRVLKEKGIIHFQFYNLERDNNDDDDAHILQYLDLHSIEKIFKKHSIEIQRLEGMRTHYAWVTGIKN